MGEGLMMAGFGILDEIRQTFDLHEADASQYSPLVLAYIGDCIYELVNRTLAVESSDKQVEKLHKECAGRANAGAQARVMDVIEPLLSEEELRFFRRGRNAGINTKAKNQTTADYHRATGLEALMGYLYLTGKTDRMLELLKEGFSKLNA